MGGFDETIAAALLNLAFGVATGPVFTGPAMLRLVSTVPTETSAATELPGGGGYTTGGIDLTGLISSASSSVIALPNTPIALNNSSGADWTIAGWELYDSSSPAVRWEWDTWDTPDGLPVTVPDGTPFNIPTGAIQFDVVPG
jgi:hypothetical protein